MGNGSGTHMGRWNPPQPVPPGGRNELHNGIVQDEHNPQSNQKMLLVAAEIYQDVPWNHLEPQWKHHGFHNSRPPVTPGWIPNRMDLDTSLYILGFDLYLG